MEAFRKFIERYTQVCDTDWQIIVQSFERQEFQKNELIQEEGAVCWYFYFLEEGLIRFLC